MAKPKFVETLTERFSIAVELLEFFWMKRFWWMAPLVGVVLLVGLLLVFGQHSILSPFIYLMF